MTILVLIGMVFVISLEMFHGKMSLNSVLLLMLVNFVSRFRLELIYISLIVNIRSSLTQTFSWFLAAHINPFCLYQLNESSESKVKFRQTSNHFKKVLEVAKLS